MVLYKPDCNSNDCDLPNKKATPLNLAIEVWLVRLHSGIARGKLRGLEHPLLLLD